MRRRKRRHSGALTSATTRRWQLRQWIKQHEQLCDSQEGDQTRDKSADAGDDDDDVAEPLASAALDGVRVHVSKGGCSHVGGGVGCEVSRKADGWRAR